MMRKLFFQTTVFIFFAFSLVACRNEKEALKNENAVAQKKHDQISLSDFKNQTEITSLDKHLSFESEKHKSHDSINVFNSFQIDSTTIYRLKANPNITTYSFRAYHRFQDPRNVYNLVFVRKNNSVEFSLLHLTATGVFKIFESHNKQSHSNKNDDCESSYTLWNCKNDEAFGGCDMCSDCLKTVCVGSGGGSNGGGYDGGYYDPNTGNNNGTPEGGSPSGTYSDPSGYIFDPNAPLSTDAQYVRASRAYTFFGQLDSIGYQAKHWANDHAYTYCLILENYLNKWTVGNNQQNLDFHNWAIQFLMTNSNATNYFNEHSDEFLSIMSDNFVINGDFGFQTYNTTANVLMDLLMNQQNGTLQNLDTSWPNWDNLQYNLKESFKSSIPVAVKLGRYVFSSLKKVTDKYPATLTYANKGIDKMRTEIHNEGLINYNVHTMKWKDVVGCWLFELGNYPINNTVGYSNMPTLGFAGADYVISGIPNQLNQMRYMVAHKTLGNGNLSPNSIIDLKRQAMIQIKSGNLSPINKQWGFGFDPMVDTIKELDGLQFCLGSYVTTVSIVSLGSKQYKLTFVVKNKTGWESGTRGLNDGDNNPHNDSVIDDKPRGQGLHLGGTIGETFGWYETVTIP